MLSVPDYPMLDDRIGSMRHPNAPIGDFIWTTQDNRLGWSSFLSHKPGGITVPVIAVLARCKSLRGASTNLHGVGALDLFVDENIEYAKHLVDDGVPTELHIIPADYHGFDDLVPQARISQTFIDTLNASLKVTFSLKDVDAGDQRQKKMADTD